MNSDWSLRQVRTLLDSGLLLVEDGNHGEYRPLATEFTMAGTPFIRPDDLKYGRVDFSNCDYINDQAVKRVRKGHGRPFDVLLTHRATVGRLAFVRHSDPIFVANPGVTIWRSLDPKNLDPAFLYYRLHAKDFTDQLWAVAGSTDTFPYASLTEQRKLWLTLPSHITQVAIAATLSALDEKIDLNRRMNETLEAMSRAILKDWFVDFGPTRAKIEGRSPYLSAELWSLFPDQIDKSGLPTGWRMDRLGAHIVNYDAQRVPVSGAERSKRQGPYPYYGAAALMDHIDGYLFDGTYVLVGEDGSVMAPDEKAITQYVWGKFWVNNHAHVLRGRDPVSTEHILMYFGQESVAPYITGAVQMKLSQGRMNSMPFLYAGSEACRAFDSLTAPLFAMMRKNADEISSLAAMRDLLLPKLMSGELRVRDAERVVEGVI